MYVIRTLKISPRFVKFYDNLAQHVPKSNIGASKLHQFHKQNTSINDILPLPCDELRAEHQGSQIWSQIVPVRPK